MHIHTIGTLKKWITLIDPYAEWGSLVCRRWHGTLRTSATEYLVIESRTEEAQKKSDLLLRDLITSRRGRQTFVQQGERMQEFSFGTFRIHWPSGLSRYFSGIKGKNIVLKHNHYNLRIISLKAPFLHTRTLTKLLIWPLGSSQIWILRPVPRVAAHTFSLQVSSAHPWGAQQNRSSVCKII